MLDAECAPRLVQLLSAVPDPSVQSPTLSLVGNILSGTDTQTQTMIDLGVLPIMLALTHHPKKNVRKEAVWSLSNTTSGPPHHVNAVLDTPGVIARMVALMKAPEPDVRKEAIWVVSNATNGADPVIIARLVDALVVGPLTDVLLSEDGPKVVEVALEALDNILTVSKEHHPAAFHTALHSVASHSGVQALQALQEQGGGVGDRAAVVLEAFASDFEDMGDGGTLTPATEPRLKPKDTATTASNTESKASSVPGPKPALQDATGVAATPPPAAATAAPAAATASAEWSSPSMATTAFGSMTLTQSVVLDDPFGSTLNGSFITPSRDKQRTLWKGGKILKKYGDGTYDIQLANGGIMARVQRSAIRPRRSTKVAAMT